MMRYEIKYALDPMGLIEFSQWIASAAYFRRAYSRRGVHSVYFDTAEMGSARDNLSGIGVRNKFRVRWYSDVNGKEVFASAKPKFEIKSKQGRLGTKYDRVLETIDGSRIHTEDGNQLTNELRKELAANPWRDLPVSIDVLNANLLVEYERDYYVGPGDVRVTIDHNVTYGDVMSNTHSRLIGQNAYSKAIVEFKFSPNYKDQAAELMSTLPFYPVRNSKYLTGLSLFGHAVYL
ncbi:MAG: polyphosphate polymerase domain-containing protein [Rhodospirillales bacterium]|jgi:hypothetical protein|nr:polyphosphate polymerase domain-containing protein [Rhodospirillales bacterium]